MTFLSSLIGSKAALATVAIGALALGGAGIAFAETASTNDHMIGIAFVDDVGGVVAVLAAAGGHVNRKQVAQPTTDVLYRSE
jgi:hypothetical protein